LRIFFRETTRPSDIEEVLVPYLDDEFASIRKEMICELACRGNPAATKKLQETMATWPTADLDGDDKWVRRNEIETLCKLVADLKLREAKDGLESARSIDVPRIAISVNGALAVMGDKEALADLHRAAGEGDVSDRARAVEMCRYLDDEESTALVKNAAESDQRQLQYAATKELQRFRARRE
jgi:HEAT repeat protein